MKTTTLTRPLVGALAATAAVSSLLLVPGAAHGAVHGAAATKEPYFGGQAYGSIVGLSTLARSGKTAYAPLCTPKVGAKTANSTAALVVPGLGRIGAVTDRIASAGHRSGVSSTSISHTSATSLLGGLIHADALVATARVLKSSSSNYIGTGTVSLVNLSILGTKLPSTATPNQTVTLPGVGEVILNHVTQSRRGANHTVKVTALRLRLNPGNTLGLPSGNVTIGHAVASVHAPVSHQAYGSAYGTTVEAANVVKSGKTALVGMGCGGTGGATVANSLAGAKLNSVLQAGVTRSTARSTETATRTVATTRTRVAHVNLLDGAIKSAGIVARAEVTRTGSKLTRSDAGTSLSGLTINGQSVAPPTTPTSRTIPGLAKLYFNYATKTRTGMQVYALRVVLLEATDGLSSGAIITVGAAAAGVKA